MSSEINIKELGTQLNKASSIKMLSPLVRSNTRLRRLIGQDIMKGQITEFGIPHGYGGRNLVLDYISKASATDNFRCVWVNCLEDLELYATNLHSQGVDPGKIYTTKTIRPIKDLYHLFRSDYFELIVLDSPKLSKLDQNFLIRCARKNNYSLVIIRNHFLTNKFGNIFSNIRINITASDTGSGFSIHKVKSVHGGRG